MWTCTLHLRQVRNNTNTTKWSTPVVDMRLHGLLSARVKNNNNNNKARQVRAFLLCVTSWSSPVVDMVLHGDHGSAWRRRQRRLRSWWRHEQLSVAMALSSAVHHSFDKVAAGAKYYGLRAQKTDRPGRLRTELYGDRSPGRQGNRSSGSCLRKSPAESASTSA